MQIVSVWEQGDVFDCYVCLLLTPQDWQNLRAVHRTMNRRLGPVEAKRLFAAQLQDRVSATAGLSQVARTTEEPNELTLEGLLALAAAVGVVDEVIQYVLAHKRLADDELIFVYQVLQRLRRLILPDRSMMPRERGGRRSSLPRKIMRCFASLDGLVTNLVALLSAFPAERMPEAVFVAACEVLASVIHNSKDSKKSFVAAGGLGNLLAALRARPGSSELQAAGLAVLLALSARSANSICLMADAGAPEIVTGALQRFPADTKVATRATGLLANMSNVPCVCAALQKCGVLSLARALLAKDAEAPSQHSQHAQHSQLPFEEASSFVLDFVKYLLSNLQEQV